MGEKHVCKVSCTPHPKARSPTALQFWGYSLLMPTPFDIERQLSAWSWLTPQCAPCPLVQTWGMTYFGVSRAAGQPGVGAGSTLSSLAVSSYTLWRTPCSKKQPPLGHFYLYNIFGFCWALLTILHRNNQKWSTGTQSTTSPYKCSIVLTLKWWRGHRNQAILNRHSRPLCSLCAFFDSNTYGGVACI